jgi:AraC family transcriptional regulator
LAPGGVAAGSSGGAALPFAARAVRSSFGANGADIADEDGALLPNCTVFEHLRGARVALQRHATLGDGVAAALWDRDETATARYDEPSHHTLSLYVAGGEAFCRRRGQSLQRSLGPGSLCLMPRGASSHWDVAGPVRMFHLYFSRATFDRFALETLGADPARLALREVTYFRDPVIEGLVRSTFLALDWRENGHRVALAHAAQTLLAYLATGMTDRSPDANAARGGLSPSALRRLVDFVWENLGEALSLDDLAASAGLSPFHFARAFKRSTGETPHAFVTRCRVERAKDALRRGEAIADTALACGFSSQSHFTAAFRRRVGATPGRFRAGVSVP